MLNSDSMSIDLFLKGFHLTSRKAKFLNIAHQSTSAQMILDQVFSCFRIDRKRNSVLVKDSDTGVWAPSLDNIIMYCGV
jgi:hypothetical protein